MRSLDDFSLDSWFLRSKILPVTSLFRTLFLLLTFLGVGIRVSDLHAVVHDISHVVCEYGHEHEHEHDAPTPCHDPQHHHHQCACAQPVSCLPEFPEVSVAQILGTQSPQPERCDWELPDDPVYALDVPPIIG